MDTATLNAYETRAAEFAARYGAADLAPLHRLLLVHLPPAGRVLEIGCGTGREAAFLAEHGFTVIATDAAAGCRWVAVPERLAGQNRFVVQIAGDSMAPDLNVGDTVVFEYHRSPRAPDQIVIANLAESGISSDLTTEHAVKRLRQTPDQWIFHSTNPRYDDIRIPKTDCAYPILGIMVGRL